MGAYVKCSEMDLNVKPQTLVEAFDHQANYNSIPEYNVAVFSPGFYNNQGELTPG